MKWSALSLIHWDLYYQRKLLNLANNRIERYVSLSFLWYEIISATPKESITPGEGSKLLILLFKVNSLVEMFTQLICTLMFVLVLEELMDPPYSQAAVTKHYHQTSCISIVTIFPTKKR